MCSGSSPSIEVVGLLTTLNSEFDRVAMHGTRRSVLEAQADAAQLPLWIIPLPWPCSNEIYEQRMGEACQRAVCERIDAIAFGDLFLRDVREYREKQLAPTGLEPLFPLWEIPTRQLALEMIAAGLRAKLVCVDSRQLDTTFAGRDFDPSFLRDLPRRNRPLRRTRRIPLLRLRRPHVLRAHRAGARRNRQPRWLRLSRTSVCRHSQSKLHPFIREHSPRSAVSNPPRPGTLDDDAVVALR